MRYLYSTLFIIFLPLISNAQLSKGLKQVGGVFTASQYQEENEYEIGNSFLIDKSIIREISIIPNLGFFIKDNTSLGLGIGYKNSFERYEYDSQKFDRESNLVEVKVFARFHKPVTESFYLFNLW
ncbi:hypothetical protein [Chondrinema litorale]|uniref:hypothetical protein n=1 Tax=Chondrinema litorale TaxID=2994555 RepID=UPI002543E0B5|nr:hypothetical protein [Chondrinema litorale]UZR96188.1 hypothetical protein OQ292_10260 [Chondrinema litorale]